MKMKFSIAVLLAMALTATFNSLVLADDTLAHILFTTDAPCPVMVNVFNSPEPGHETPWIYDTNPNTSVSYIYQLHVVCDDGINYEVKSFSPGNPVTSGAAGTTITVTAHYLPVADTTPPVLILPDNMIVPAPNASGAVVSFTASANDAVDGPLPVNCSPASGSLFPIGTTTVNCSATDSDNNTADGSFTITVQLAATGQCKGVPGHQILPPINSDGSSVFKQGRTVPAKFRVCDADGKPITTDGLVTDFKLVQIISNGIVSNVNEVVLSANAHDEFRAGARQWIFNISTKNLTADNTYLYLITLNDGSTIQFQFTLK